MSGAGFMPIRAEDPARFSSVVVTAGGHDHCQRFTFIRTLSVVLTKIESCTVGIGDSFLLLKINRLWRNYLPGKDISRL